ncbi:MAG: 3-ketoacyl-CoA thiolase [Bacteroidetes bacterium]|nr:3-ketoacyl-CoA thiolase [Bacteroidota bacterium]MBU1114076.1 3-ketoacyl-CoA thiolase [Bacteroidota bacterium]MBU1798271.1 3-ketoacyl-CoA thiolase [Bacteroidota bacterium]
MKKKIFITAGYNTISLGTGRKEFNPKKERPGLEHYVKEAGSEVLKRIGGAINVDETVISNFNAAQYNNQGNLPGYAPFIDNDLKYKPSTRVEGACGSGGLALATSIKFLLSEESEVILALGVEVQNTVKAVYGADYLATAGWWKDRKDGHAHFFPGQFSDRAGKYYEKYGKEYTRKGMIQWYVNAINNARLDDTAQEYHNTDYNLSQTASIEPSGKVFVDNLTVYDCSKVSDASSAIVVLTEEGLKRCNIDIKDAVEIIAFAQSEDDITTKPEDPTRLLTTENAVKKALKMAGITKEQIGTVEAHDCFSIAGIMAIEAIGFAEHGKGPEFVLNGNTAHNGIIPFNTTGGLIGWGHPVGATGIHQAVTMWQQLTEKAGKAQISLNNDKPYGMTINMGGDDKTVTVIIYKKL